LKVIPSSDLRQKESKSKGTRKIPALERDIIERKQAKMSIAKSNEPIIATRINTNMSEENIEEDIIIEKLLRELDEKKVSQFRMIFPNKEEKSGIIEPLTTDNFVSIDDQDKTIQLDEHSKIELELKELILSGIIPGNSGDSMIIEEESNSKLFFKICYKKFIVVDKKCVMCKCELNQIFSQKRDDKENFCQKCFEDLE